MPVSTSTVPVQAPTRPPRTGIVITVVLTAQLMLVLDAAIVNIALPDIRSALHMTSTGLSWVVNAYTISFGGLLLLGARAGDVLGRRRVFIAGLALFTASSLVGGLADQAAVLLAARAAQGVGAALAAPSALALLLAAVRPGHEQTRAIGWYTVVSAGGAAVGLIAGGVLTSIASWRWIFFVNVPVGAVILALAVWSLPRVTRHRGPVDVVGAVLATVGMTSLVYGFIRAASAGWTDLGTIAAFGAGILLMGTFVAVEVQIDHPITPLHLFADRGRSTAYVARLLLVAGALGTYFFMSQFMQIVLHWTSWQTGLAFLPVPFGVFVASQLVSRVMTQRWSERMIIVFGLTLAAAGLLWASTMSAGNGYGHVAPGILLFGLGQGIAVVPLTAAGMARVSPEDSGAASGLVNMTQQLGGSLGLAILVTVFATAATKDTSPAAQIEAFAAGADRGFVAAGILVLVATVLVATLMPRTSPRAEPTAETPEVVPAESR